MEALKIIYQILHEFGVVGVLVLVLCATVAVLLWEKVGILWKKYISKKYTSWKDVESENTGLRMRVASLENKLDHHLEKAAMESIRLERMEVETVNLKEIAIELKQSRQKLFDMISDIKSLLIQWSRERKS